MPKVVLVNPPQSQSFPQPPMGLALLASILETYGYQVSVLDANALRLKPEDVPALVAGADVVGLTAMTPTIGSAMEIARHLKRASPNLNIVLGGGHATLLPEETLAGCHDIDILVSGEGERAIVRLLQSLEFGQSLEGIPGVSYRRDGKIVHNPRSSQLVDLDSLPFLAYHLLPWRSYRPHPPHGRAFPFAAMITSRGCPYHCSYCSKPIFGTKYRAQSPERVMEEITYYRKRFGVKEIAFYDDVFTLDKKRAHTIAEGMINLGNKIVWTCETRVNLIDKELLRHLKEAGCYGIAYGIESGSPDILRTLDKGITLEQIEEALRATKEVGLATIGYFMFGSPGDTAETLKKTIDFAKKLDLDFAQFSVTIPFPGTELYSKYLQEGGEPLPWESFVYAGAAKGRPSYFGPAGMNGEELGKWVSRAYRQFYLRPSYLWKRLRSSTSLGDLRVNFNGISMLAGTLRRQR